MLKNRLSALSLLADKLLSTENAIDDAIVSAAELTCASPRARRMANVSPLVDEKALALVGEAMAALHLARTKLAEAHHAYADVRDGLGLKPYAAGDLWKLGASASPLTVVESEAA